MNKHIEFLKRLKNNYLLQLAWINTELERIDKKLKEKER